MLSSTCIRMSAMLSWMAWTLRIIKKNLNPICYLSIAKTDLWIGKTLNHNYEWCRGLCSWLVKEGVCWFSLVMDSFVNQSVHLKFWLLADKNGYCKIGLSTVASIRRIPSLYKWFNTYLPDLCNLYRQYTTLITGEGLISRFAEARTKTITIFNLGKRFRIFDSQNHDDKN